MAWSEDTAESRGETGMPRVHLTAARPFKLNTSPDQHTSTMASTKAYPPGGTFLDSIKRSFTDVPVDKENDNAISTSEFLEASESLTTLFGTLKIPHTLEAVADNPRCPRFNGFPTRQERHARECQGLFVSRSQRDVTDPPRK